MEARKSVPFSVFCNLYSLLCNVFLFCAAYIFRFLKYTFSVLCSVSFLFCAAEIYFPLCKWDFERQHHHHFPLIVKNIFWFIWCKVNSGISTGKNNKNSGVMGHLEVRGNISHKKSIKIVGFGELCTIIMCSGARFRQSLFNNKSEIKTKSNAFSFCLIFFLEGLTRVRCIISIDRNINWKSVRVLKPSKHMSLESNCFWCWTNDNSELKISWHKMFELQNMGDVLGGGDWHQKGC